jgi:hypothetical protein
MEVDKRAIGKDPSGMPKEFWAAYWAWLEQGLCDEELAEAIVQWFVDAEECDDDYYDHVKPAGETHSGQCWRSLIEHLCALHMHKKHQGKCLAESATPLLYTVVEPLAGLGTHLLYVNPGATERHFFGFALNFGNRGRVFAPEGWSKSDNPGYIAYRAAGFSQPTIFKTLEVHMRTNKPLHPRPAPVSTINVIDAVAVVEAERAVESEPALPASPVPSAVPSPVGGGVGTGGAAGKRPVAQVAAVAPWVHKKKLKKAHKAAAAEPKRTPPEPKRKPGFFTSYAPTKCCLTHEAWGGSNQCELTNGHDGPHLYQARVRGTDQWEWQPKLRDDNHKFEPWERELADVADLETFGAQALPVAAERQAAREAARAVAAQVTRDAGGALAHSTEDLGGPTSPGLEMLSEAAGGVGRAPAPVSPSWSVDLQLDEAQRQAETETEKGTDGSESCESDAIVVAGGARPTVVQLASALEKKELELADLKLRQLQTEGVVEHLKAAIAARVA